MNCVLLFSDNELSNAVSRYLQYVIGDVKITHAILGHPEMLTPDILHADLWIIEAFNPSDITNPEGFRTAKKLASRTKILLIFYYLPKNIPVEGNFWLKLPCMTKLSTKIKEVLNKPAPNINEFNTLESLWSALKGQPRHHRQLI